VSELGLFPLPLVLLPTEQLPLHIFEDRYKELIGECLADDLEFGLVFADDDGVRQIGTRAGVLEVLPPPFPDGRMNVLVEGRERFRVVELTEGRSFHTADTAPVDDDDDPASDDVVERARMLFGRLRELTGSNVEVPDPALPQLSYALASRVELANEIKLGLLAEVSERLRLEQVCEILQEAAISVERQRRAAERAATNGKVDTSI
jgi:Lon protease-like protein